ncbi:guanylate-binding protein 2-like isoform X2 [Mercenaria mercenaria]|uniref:guanylate-binding protein 2-like isoform X2 n=1 Tax=Mercenaria mercenaria TaxID=6596 RepID=UPI00234F088C|nr:guanylate-binding protein 2-like isoform X2 [Mercenaria mercenaria]
MNSKKSITSGSLRRKRGGTATKHEGLSTSTSSESGTTTKRDEPSTSISSKSVTATKREGPFARTLSKSGTGTKRVGQSTSTSSKSGIATKREGPCASTSSTSGIANKRDGPSKITLSKRDTSSSKLGASASASKTVHSLPGSSGKRHDHCFSTMNPRTTTPYTSTVISVGKRSSTHVASRRNSRRNALKRKEETITDHLETDQVSGRTPRDLDVFSKPMCLIYNGEDGKLYTKSGTIESICKIEARLHIVGIAGPFRTGKSYLINKLAGKSGFIVGDSTKAVTKGIWVWCRQHPTCSEEPTVLVLLDTEGLGDIKKGNKHHDQKIMTLVTLLCNSLVYNMIGRFDDDSMSKLSFASQISSWVKFGDTAENEEKLGCVMPELVLVLRDFILKFAKGIDSPKAYFEDCLCADSGIEEYDEPRRDLKKYFPDRECFVLPTPGDDDVMARLDSAKDSELKETFKKGVNEMTEHILGSPPKLMFDSEAKVSSPINGTIFKSLVEHYVDCINNGRIPNIEDAYFIAAKEKNKAIGEKIIEQFKAEIKRVFPLPLPAIEEVQNKVFQLISDELHSCRKKMKMDKDFEIEDDVRKALEQIWHDYRKENSRSLQKTLLCYLDERYSTSSENESGYEAFKDRMNKLKTEFKKSFNHIDEDEVIRAWASFSDKMQETEINVLRKDRHLTNSEKEEQINQLKAENEKVLAETRKRGELEAQRLWEKLKLQKEREMHAENEMKHLRGELNALKHRTFYGRLKYLLSGN